MSRLLLTNSNDSIFEVELIRYFSYDQEYYLIYTLNEKDDKNYLKLYLVEILEELGEPLAYNIRDDSEWKGMQDIVKKVIKEIKAGTRKLLIDESPLMLEKLKIDEARYFKLDEKLAAILSSNYSYSDSSDLSNEEMKKIRINIKEKDFIEPIDLPSDELIILETEEGENMIDKDNDMIINENKSEDIDGSIVESNIETNISESSLTSPIDVDDMVNGGVQDNLDYKALYFAIKEEKEATDVLVNDLLQKLLKYKEKYGELND